MRFGAGSMTENGQQACPIRDILNFGGYMFDESRTHYTSEIPSPVGHLTAIATDQGLCALLWENENLAGIEKPAQMKQNPKHPILVQTQRELGEYFGGSRTSFSIPLTPMGTPFQVSVWQTLRKIAFAETICYGEQALRLGDSKKARAVGAANGKNPISIIIPCHRVIGKSGDLTGFAGGLGTKRFLLDLEQKINFNQERYLV